jgi:hypothetical protein
MASFLKKKKSTSSQVGIINYDESDEDIKQLNFDSAVPKPSESLIQEYLEREGLNHQDHQQDSLLDRYDLIYGLTPKLYKKMKKNHEFETMEEK